MTTFVEGDVIRMGDTRLGLVCRGAEYVATFRTHWADDLGVGYAEYLRQRTRNGKHMAPDYWGTEHVRHWESAKRIGNILTPVWIDGFGVAHSLASIRCG